MSGTTGMMERPRPSVGADLSLLDIELRRLTRRASRQRQQMRLDTEAWRRWSATIDEGFNIIGRIDHAPARDLAGLSVKFRAILWRVRIDEDVIMDEAVRRALDGFGRQLTHLVRQAG